MTMMKTEVRNYVDIDDKELLSSVLERLQAIASAAPADAWTEIGLRYSAGEDLPEAVLYVAYERDATPDEIAYRQRLAERDRESRRAEYLRLKAEFGGEV